MLIQGQKIPSRYWKLVAGFSAVIVLGVAIGLVNQNPRHSLWEDVKPLLYFFVLPFFALTIDQKEMQTITAIFKSGSIIIAGVFFVLLVLIHSGLLPFLSFYRWTKESQELFYRGELSFFYKGFLFLGIGALFFFFTGTKNKNYAIALLITAIIVSVTRGLLFSLAVTFCIYFFFQRKIVFAFLNGVLAIVILVWGNRVTENLSKLMDSNKQQVAFTKSSPDLFGVRKYSDEGRVTQVKEVLQATTFQSVFVGHGFGAGIPSRPVHMEIAYLEVFHKEGMVGLLFWTILSAMILAAFRKSDQSERSCVFLLSSLFVFIESATNQYFNNPIGLSVLLLSLICLDKQRKIV